MLIVTKHQREREDGTYVAADSVECKYGPVDQTKINGEGWGVSQWFTCHVDSYRKESSYLGWKIVTFLGDQGLKTLSYAGNIFPTETVFQL